MKLNVQILPCVISFVDGVTSDRIIGFEGLGRGNDKFTTRDLEVRLLTSNVLVRPKISSVVSPGPRCHGRSNTSSSASDDHDDED